MPATRKPVIAITGPSAFSDNITEMLEEFQEANFIPIYHNEVDNIKYWADHCDALLIAGGVDIHPSVYGENVKNYQGLTGFDIDRDKRELLLIELFQKSKKPMLAICRGFQLFSIYKGLEDDFIQDISDSVVCHQPRKEGINLRAKEPTHFIQILPDNTSFLEEEEERKIFNKILNNHKKKVRYINSFHHQAVAFNEDVNYSEKNIEIIGTSEAYRGDENERPIIEAMMGINKENWIAVQFHPEYDYRWNTMSRLVLKMFDEKVQAQLKK